MKALVVITAVVEVEVAMTEVDRNFSLLGLPPDPDPLKRAAEYIRRNCSAEIRSQGLICESDVLVTGTTLLED